AGTVIYTDHAHPVADGLAADVTVVELDAPDRLQAQLFGELPTDPVQAERQARAVIASPLFPQRQPQRAGKYAGVTRSWYRGLEKEPAVVLADKRVVSGIRG
ncbi:TIGR03757 family integrating conjugative element protein, partial [Erwinia amylovora]|uniref:TIGR03757 family integrating conjugative element protein n=1 Tax=Erwinia amylovora TaxID=552 RepID=UPI000FE3CA50